MEKLPMCRVCLAENVRMYVVVNKNLHELYARLTDNPFITKDNRPMLACFFCCTKLKQCCQFQRKCLEAEELFTQMMNKDYEPKPLIDQDHLKCFNGFIQSPIVRLSIFDDECQKESDDIEEQLPAVCERPDDIIEPKEEYLSDEFEMENLNNSYSDIEDMQAQQSHIDLEDDLLLMKIKTEVEDEDEAPKKKRTASDTHQDELDNLNNSYSVIEDMPAQQSESDLEDDLPLMEIKTEVEDEDETPKKKRTASDTQQDSNLSNNPRAKKYQCNKCKQIFDELSALKVHVVSRHGLSDPSYSPPNLKYTCSKCGKSLKTKKKLEQHRLGHGDPELECNKCHKVFATKFTLRNHRMIHTRKFNCSKCSRTFLTMQELKEHSSNFHVTLMCNSCSFVCKTTSELAAHEKLHSSFEPLKTPDSVIAKVMSNNIFQTNSQTKKIRRRFNKSCEVCLKQFHRIGELKRHLIEHVITSTLAKIPVNKYGVLNIRCEVCQGKVFTNVDSYKAHLREHAELTKYKCTLCNKTFSDSSNFCKHKKLHGSSYFKCDMCQRKFSSKKMLTQHMEYHNRNRPIQCQYCDKVFYFKSMLNKHMRSLHTKETKFRCPFCRQYFNTLREKWDHEWLVHNARKVVLDCLVCGSRFRKFIELKRHCSEEHDIPPSYLKLKKKKKSQLKTVDEDQNKTGP